MRVGIAVACTVCGLRKKPVGRSAAPEMSNSFCDSDCEGYYKEPLPGSLWPNETEIAVWDWFHSEFAQIPALASPPRRKPHDIEAIRDLAGESMIQAERIEHFRVLNQQRCAEAMQLLYQTYIIDPKIAEDRGLAIQAINRMILAFGGEDTISKIEAVPYTARLRASGEPELVQLAKDLKEDFP